MKRALILCVCLLLVAGVASADSMSRTCPWKQKVGVSQPIGRDFFEGFNGPEFPPVDWTEVETCVTDSCTDWNLLESCEAGTFSDAYEGVDCAYVHWQWDNFAPGQDEWLKFTYDLDEREVNTLSFWTEGSGYYCSNANFVVTIDGVEVWDFCSTAPTSWVWYEYEIDLTPYRGEVEIGFGYVGADGADHYLDAVSLFYEEPPEPPCCPLDVVCYDFDFNVSDCGVALELCDGGVTTWEWGVPDPLVPVLACDDVPVTNVLGTTLVGSYPLLAGEIAMIGPVDITEDCWCMDLCHYYEFESDYSIWDCGNVKVSPDGGATWFLVYPADGYDGIANDCIDTYHPLCVCEEEVFGHSSGTFVRDCFDLRAYMGETVMIGFFFGSDSSVAYLGWYIKWAKIGRPQGTAVEQSSWGNIKALYR